MIKPSRASTSPRKTSLQILAGSLAGLDPQHSYKLNKNKKRAKKIIHNTAEAANCDYP